MPVSRRKLDPKEEDDPEKDASSPLNRLKTKLRRLGETGKLEKKKLRRSS